MDSLQGTRREPDMEGLVFEREIGTGGSGTVHVARDAAGRRMAVKVAADGSAAAAQVERELEVLGRLRHRHLVELYGAVETVRGTAIVMEYLPGGSVADVVRARGPIGLGEAVTVLAPAAAALAYLHESGVVHGDVAPGNLLFTADGMPKLGDLGLAAVLGRRGRAGGTPGFCAPEAADATDAAGPAGGPVLRPARDVYSLGALAWYLLTGRTPAATHQRPPLGSLLPSVPDDFAELVEACLSEDPAARPAAADVARLVFCGAAPAPVELTDSVHPEALGELVTRLADEQPPGRGWFRRAFGRRQRAAEAGQATSRHGRQRRRDRQVPRVRPASSRPRQREAGAHAAASPGWPASRSAATGGHSAWRSAGGGRRAAWRTAVGVLAAGLLATGTWWAVGSGPVAPPSETPAAAQPTESQTGNGSPQPTSVPASLPTAVPTEPGAAAVVLAQRRDAALTAADPDALAGVHHPDGTSLEADRAVVSELLAAGRRYAGLRTELDAVDVLPGATGDAATVVAVSRIGPYRLTTLAGETVSEVPATKVQRLRLELGRDGHGQWLIRRVLEAGPGA